MKRNVITSPIRLLSLVSLLAAMASEMLYPILPVYLRSAGFSVALIGLVEGLAEATAGLSKGYFGQLSDRRRQRLPFVRMGYGLSALSRPMMALLAVPAWILAARTLDRLGKGLRTAAGDALLADQSVVRFRGQVFGFHRAMDTLGAVLGPLVALVYLSFFPGQYAPLFLLAFGPALLSVGLTFVLTEPASHATAPRLAPPQPVSVWGFLRYWRASSPAYRRVVGGLLAFALFNSSDIFLLLKMKEAGLSDTTVIGLYILSNVVQALGAYPAGWLADRFSLKLTVLIGLSLFAVVYQSMTVANQLGSFMGLMALYGLYGAATQGIVKAWISTVSAAGDRATAIGTYSGLSSLGVLVANALAGGLWSTFGPAATFGVTGVATLLVIVYLAALEERPLTRRDKPELPVVVVGRQPGAYGSSAGQAGVTMSPSSFVALLLVVAGLGGATVYFWLVPTALMNRLGRLSLNRSAVVSADTGLTTPIRPHRTAVAETAGRKTLTANSPDRPPVARTHKPVAGPVREAASATGPVKDRRPKLTAVADSPVVKAGDQRYTLVSRYAYFHNEPDRSTRRAAFINIWNQARLTPLADQNGFIYVIYINDQGQTSRGWLLKENLKPIKP